MGTLKKALDKTSGDVLIGLGTKKKTYFVLAYKDKIMKTFKDYLDKKIKFITIEKIDKYNSYLSIII